MKRSFTLLELIFVIVLIAVIAGIAFPKLFLNIINAQYVKIQSDVALIRSAVIHNRNQNIISGKGEAYIPFLDRAVINSANEKLFVGYEGEVLLQYPILSTNITQKEIARWIKISQYDYKVYLNDLESVLFTYNSELGTFECDLKQELCRDLMQ